MWVSEREKIRELLKKEFSRLKNEVLSEDLESLLQKVNIWYEKKDHLIAEIPFMDEKISVTVPAFVFRKTHAGNLEMMAKVVILRYFKELRSISEEESEEFVNLKETGVVPSRITRPLEKAFAYNSKGFLACAQGAGGQISSSPGCGIIFSVLPGFKFFLTFSEADEERGAELEVFLAKKFVQIFPRRDILYIVRLLLRKILKQAKRNFYDYDG